MKSSASKSVDIASSSAALTVVVQVAAAFNPGVNPLVVAAVASLFFATRGYGIRFWKAPVDWVLTAMLILGSANGVTNILANVQEQGVRMSAPQAFRALEVSASLVKPAPPPPVELGEGDMEEAFESWFFAAVENMDYENVEVVPVEEEESIEEVESMSGGPPPPMDMPQQQMLPQIKRW